MRYTFYNVRRFLTRYPLSSVVFLSLLFFSIGTLVSPVLATGYKSIFSPHVAQPRGLRLADKEFPLINPLLLCSLDINVVNENKSLTEIVKQFVNDRISNGAAEDMSVYLIQYKTGEWVGVNENDKYDPASMLKVPIMIAYYQLAEGNPGILSEQVSFNGTDQNADEYFKSTQDIQPGKFYTIEQLMEHMIGNSDNTAAILLQKEITNNYLQKVYADLGLPTPPATSGVQYLSAKLYAYFFRVLYNATYLSHEYSQKALELLAEPDFPQGIQSGVPKGVTIAQKFGERTVYDANKTPVDRELHDCGLVYKPNSPYLLCIMSRGKNFDVLAKNISDLSALVYANDD